MTISPTKALSNVLGAITREFLKGTFSFETDIEHTFSDKPVHVHVSNYKRTEQMKHQSATRTKARRAYE